MKKTLETASKIIPEMESKLTKVKPPGVFDVFTEEPHDRWKSARIIGTGILMITTAGAATFGVEKVSQTHQNLSEVKKAQKALDKAQEVSEKQVRANIGQELEDARKKNPELTFDHAEILVKESLKTQMELFPLMVRSQLAAQKTRHTVQTEDCWFIRREVDPMMAVRVYLYPNDSSGSLMDKEVTGKANFFEIEKEILAEQITMFEFSSVEAQNLKKVWTLPQVNRRNTNPELSTDDFPVQKADTAAPSAVPYLERRGSGPPALPPGRETGVTPGSDLPASAPAATLAPQAAHASEASPPAAAPASQLAQTNEASAPAATAESQTLCTGQSGVSSVLETNVFSIEYILCFIAFCSQKITLSAIFVWVCVKLALVLKMYVIIALMACIAHEIWPEHIQTNWRECTVLYRRIRIGLFLLSILLWLL